MSFWPLISDLQVELLAYARSISDSREDAEDLVGDAIERAARSKGSPEGRHALKLWMFRIIRNLNIDELRKRRVQREYSRSPNRYSMRPERDLLGIEDTVLVRRAFEGLPAAKREILYLVDVQGMKYAEAAELMGVPAGTIMSRVSRARKELLARIEPDDPLSA